MIDTMSMFCYYDSVGGRIMQMNYEFQKENSNLRNEAAFNEWRRIMRDFGSALLTEGMNQAMKEGADYLKGRLELVVRVSDWDWPPYIRRRFPNRKHLSATGRVTKGRIDYFPSWMVKFGNTAARHYHLFAFGFRKKDGGRVEGNDIMNQTTENSLPQVDQIVANAVVAREPQIIREANNRNARIVNQANI